MTALPNPESHDHAVRLERELWQRVGRAALEVPRRGRMRRGVGRDLPNEPSDVAQLELLLGRAGYYDLDRREGPTGWWSPTIEHALRKYQKDAGLTVDGWADANGESVQALTGATTAVDTPAPTGRHSLLDDDFKLPAPIGRAAGHASLLDPDKLPFDVKTEARRFIDPKGEDVPPKGEPVQVAIAPIIAAGGAVAARVIPHIARTAPIIAGALGKVAQDQMGRTTPAPPLPPLPPSPIPEPAKPDIVSTPIIEREPTTFANIPPSDLPQGWIEILPDQSGELPDFTIVENRGNEKTRAELHEIVGVFGEEVPWLEHVGGSRDKDKNEVKEEYLPPLDRDLHPGSTHGGNLIDMTMRGPNGEILRMQTASTRKDVMRLIGRERRANEKILEKTTDDENAYLVVFPKGLSSEEIRSDYFRNFARGLADGMRDKTLPRFIQYRPQGR